MTDKEYQEALDRIEYLMCSIYQLENTPILYWHLDTEGDLDKMRKELDELVNVVAEEEDKRYPDWRSAKKSKVSRGGDILSIKLLTISKK
jgi:hypothetical protein